MWSKRAATIWLLTFGLAASSWGSGCSARFVQRPTVPVYEAPQDAVAFAMDPLAWQPTDVAHQERASSWDEILALSVLAGMD